MSRIIALIAAATLTFTANASRADLLSDAGDRVDLQLVLAADTSGSMSASLRHSQRRGFAAAFRDRALQRAVSSGPVGKVAVIYFEWAGERDQRVIVPWTILSTPKDMAQFAETLEAQSEGGNGGETSISGAMRFAYELFEASALTSYRKVVDISGNGRNSQGSEVTAALRALRKGGVTVNGLVLPAPTSGESNPYAALFTHYDGPLIDYYRSEVIGGPGAFAIEVDPTRGFSDAILRKLVMEVAWVVPVMSPK
jgi:hypothetical protein